MPRPLTNGLAPASVLQPRIGLRTLPLFLELGKARLSALVLFTTIVGFVLASPDAVAWRQLAWTALGTSLAALGANALNQWLEVARDARMQRTRGRPLPSRRLTDTAALAFALTAGAVGPLLLALAVSALAALLALATLLIYVLIYTPLKVRTPLNTLVGAVVGALPPLVGWAAAAGQLEPGAWVLAGILFIWQIPHFLALAWIHREDYRRGGFRMLPVLDPDGHLTGCIVVVYILLILPLALALAFLGVAGWVYGVGSLLLGGGFLAAGVALEGCRSRGAARRVFLASVIYLPMLLGLMLIDRRSGVADRAGLAATAPQHTARAAPSPPPPKEMRSVAG
ncbi:MAG: heme o synthase [Phycisphaerae bacterium]|nr:heme o synthase [Phycisphaerae bacterium]